MTSEILKKMDRANLLVVVVLSLACAGAFSFRVALGAAAGSALMALNFHFLRRLVGFIVGGGAQPKRAAVASVLLVCKLGLFLGAVALCLTRLPVDALAFGLGAAAVIASSSVTAALHRPAGAEA